LRLNRDVRDSISALGTAAAAILALFALIVSIRVFDRTTELQANIAAGDALERHLEYAAARGVYVGDDPATQQSSADSAAEYRSAAIHGLYTANIIYDITESTDETRSWTNTAGDLLRQYKEPLRLAMEQDSSRCQELDKDFLEFARSELGRDWCSQGLSGALIVVVSTTWSSA
jgi:hypothetical protein